MINIIRSFFLTKSGEITIFALLEKIADILVALLTGILVVRLLNLDDYGIISTIAGYATIINLFNISPTNYLFKEYKRELNGKVNEAVYSYKWFEKIKSITIIVAYMVVGVYLSIINDNIGFIIIALSNGLSICIEIFVNINRTILELNFQQKRITKIIFLCRLIKLGVTFLLFLKGSLWVIFIRDIVVVSIEFTLLNRVARGFYRTNKTSISNMVHNVKSALAGFCLANHLSGVLTNFVYGSDTMFLSMYCTQNIVGQYGIALTCLNYFNPFFQVLQKNTTIEIGISESDESDRKIVKKYTCMSVMLSILSYIGFVILGRWAFYFFTGDSNLAQEIYKYGLFIFGGVCIYNMVRPLTSYLCLRGNINKYLIQTILPSAIFALLIYNYSAKKGGAYAVAVSNVVSYLFWTILVCVFYIRHKKTLFRGELH